MTEGFRVEKGDLFKLQGRASKRNSFSTQLFATAAMVATDLLAESDGAFALHHR